MISLTFGLFTQVSGSGPLGPLVCLTLKAPLSTAADKFINIFSLFFRESKT